jgi:hypothetical protein
MADTKISALATVTVGLNADFLTVVSSGANKKIARSDFLKSASGEDTTLIAANNKKVHLSMPTSGFYVGVDDSQGLFEAGVDVFEFLFTSGLACFCRGLSSGDFQVRAASGGVIRFDFNAGTNKLTFDDAAGTCVIVASGGFNANYAPTTGSDWNGTAPDDFVEALDRCATLLKSLNGGTGP